ncbi:MAG: glutamine-hydrolyzing carbamoyl-phosphate synthase small subunit [Treponema sp.]|uniref:carbamoyl phosphate synthase small subunit n=1 Tax=Treponema sp. TaxID=166 RepID=UPI0025CDB470|nr:carbamoyl phosphate synthase small subunit [Treponema sp.]MBQ9281669.1 glutamine-hydrolyzing carbamoyl-phosphate synthase small subunit [Treponema sp.]
MSDTEKAYLILADGTVFEGKAMGARGQTIGETVFTTGMTGYIETLTDPSYFGQIVTQTFPLIGNYGVINEDFESKKSYVKGYVVREICDKPSNFRCQGDLDSFLKEQNIVGICGIDTRKLTKKLREAGVMNGMILSGVESPEETVMPTEETVMPNLIRYLTEIRAYKITNAVKSVQQRETSVSGDFKGRSPLGEGAGGNGEAIAAEGETSPNKVSSSDSRLSVCLFDFGAKANIQRELEKRGCRVTVLPYDTKAEDVIALAPDGIMLSNGPGDPAENVGVIVEIRKLCEYGKIPIFGICLGHQMLALARGAKTSKLKYGHRGGNHPVKDLETNRVYISSQNHGYAVENDSLPTYARLRFVNSNDGTCEGIEYTDIPAFSVQFHPEACGGPHDTNYLFDLFLEMMENKNATK